MTSYVSCCVAIAYYMINIMNHYNHQDSHERSLLPFVDLIKINYQATLCIHCCGTCYQYQHPPRNCCKWAISGRYHGLDWCVKILVDNFCGPPCCWRWILCKLVFLWLHESRKPGRGYYNNKYIHCDTLLSIVLRMSIKWHHPPKVDAFLEPLQKLRLFGRDSLGISSYIIHCPHRWVVRRNPQQGQQQIPAIGVLRQGSTEGDHGSNNVYSSSLQTLVSVERKAM